MRWLVAMLLSRTACRLPIPRWTRCCLRASGAGGRWGLGRRIVQGHADDHSSSGKEKRAHGDQRGRAIAPAAAAAPPAWRSPTRAASARRGVIGPQPADRGWRGLVVIGGDGRRTSRARRLGPARRRCLAGRLCVRRRRVHQSRLWFWRRCRLGLWGKHRRRLGGSDPNCLGGTQFVGGAQFCRHSQRLCAPQGLLGLRWLSDWCRLGRLVWQRVRLRPHAGRARRPRRDLARRPSLGHPRQRLRIGIAAVISSCLRMLGIDRSLHAGQQVIRQCRPGGLPGSWTGRAWHSPGQRHSYSVVSHMAQTPQTNPAYTRNFVIMTELVAQHMQKGKRLRRLRRGGAPSVLCRLRDIRAAFKTRLVATRRSGSGNCDRRARPAGVPAPHAEPGRSASHRAPARPRTPYSYSRRL